MMMLIFVDIPGVHLFMTVLPNSILVFI